LQSYINRAKIMTRKCRWWW